MSILNKLTKEGSTLTQYNGTTPPSAELAGSTLHNSYSINGNPRLVRKPSPSQLDLNGETPDKYVDNLPE